MMIKGGRVLHMVRENSLETKAKYHVPGKRYIKRKQIVLFLNTAEDRTGPYRTSSGT